MRENAAYALVRNKANFGGRGGFNAGPAMVALRFPATIAKLRLTMPPTERQRRALLNKANWQGACRPGPRADCAKQSQFAVGQMNANCCSVR